MEPKRTISVCLNPRERHSVTETNFGGLLCPEPQCGFLIRGGSIDRWQVTGLLGQGPVADLYLATAIPGTPSDYPRVLLKVLRALAPGALSRLQKLLALQHRYIHPLLHAGWIDQSRRLCLLSPYEEKGSLVRSFEIADLSLQDIASITLQVAEALQYAHGQQIVHGRLKPENCLLVAPATVQICDFYRPLWPEQGRVGSSPFTAPEQLYGQTIPASDQYALAMIVYFLLSRQPMFTRSQSGTLSGQQSQGTQSSRDEQRVRLPDPLYTILKRALSKQPDERFRDIATFAMRLQAALADIATPPAYQASPVLPSSSFPGLPLISGLLPTSSDRLRISSPLPVPSDLLHISAPLPRQGSSSSPGRITPIPPHVPSSPSGNITPIPPHVSSSPPGKITPVCSLPGHTSTINRMQWAANGAYLASTSDADVRLWHIQRRIGTPLTTLSGHTDKVLALSWSPQGSLLASSGADTTIRIWHVSTTPGSVPAGQTAWWGHEGGVFALDWSPDGMRLVSGGKDRMVRVWDQKGNPVKAWQAHGRGGVSALAWSPRDSLLASGGADHQIHIWDSATGSPLLACKAHNDEIRSLSWSPDGKMLASFAGKKDRQVCLWDSHTGQLLAALTGHNREIVGLYWSNDATWLATASADATLRVWQVSPVLSKQSERPIFIPQGTPLAMAGASATDLIAVGLTNQLIQVLQLGN